jgi:hypothetical protein
MSQLGEQLRPRRCEVSTVKPFAGGGVGGGRVGVEELKPLTIACIWSLFVMKFPPAHQ